MGVTSRDKLKIKHAWPYTGNMQELADYVFKHVQDLKLTLVMTTAQYVLFAADTDAETLSANRFRPIDLTTNTCKPEWLFNGQLKLFIKIKD